MSSCSHAQPECGPCGAAKRGKIWHIKQCSLFSRKLHVVNDATGASFDLTGFGGMEKGVSRKHAVIHHSGSDYTVEDMGSTNGTYVNRKKVIPNTPEAIKPGDEIRFGKLAFSLKAA